MNQHVHIPVLFQEVLDALHLKPGMTVLDATFGGGGHARKISEITGASGKLVTLDADAEAFRRTDVRTFASPVIPVVGNFRNLDTILKEHHVTTLHAALFDLGLSSFTLETSKRGFSFQNDEPLLMTFSEDPDGVTAETVVNDWSEETLADIIYGFGDERASRRIARAIVEVRARDRITTTAKLAEIVSSVVRPGPKGRHPATRTFQAIRMAVNDEFGAIKAGVRSAVEHLAPGARIAIISFHSGEDRIVKTLFRSLSQDGKLSLITKKPIVPSVNEQKGNPRSRSAKLRVAERATDIYTDV